MIKTATQLQRKIAPNIRLATMHRGRLQSQGGGVNDSKPWAQSTPLKFKTAMSISIALESMASKKERQLRTKAHEKSRFFIKTAKANGGTGPISKTYMVKGDPQRRVDIEVRNGIAFK
jgi:hypothetical protein